MKKIIFLFAITLFSTAVYAACDITGTINTTASKNYSVGNKYYSIALSSLSNSSGDWIAKFKVNGVLTPELEETQKYTFDDLSEINMLSVISSSSVQICFNAGLSGFGKGTCTSNADCNDNNSCTIDYCDGDPLRCHHKLILWCKDGDGCCPAERCTIGNDNDCKKTSAYKCVNNSDCNDNNTLTIDLCNETAKKCINAKIIECIPNDNYCPNNCTFASDKDCDQCSEDKDCNDNNACTSDICSGTPKRCFNNATSGCNFNGTCISIGTKIENYFCNKDNTMESLKSKKEYCDNDYECLSNYCIKNKCKSISFFKKMFSWFK